MSDSSRRLMECLAEVFPLRGPVYEFSYRPADGPTLGLLGAHPLPAAMFGDEGADEDRHDDLARLPYPDRSARTIVCRGALEHVFEPRLAVEELIRILAPGGLLVVLAVDRGGGIAGPGQYWHLAPAALQRLLAPLPGNIVGFRGPDHAPRAVFGVGCKAPVPAAFVHGAGRLAECLQLASGRTGGARPWLGGLRRLAGRVALPRMRHRGDPDEARLIVHLPLDGASRREMLAGCLSEVKSGSRLDLRQ